MLHKSLVKIHLLLTFLIMLFIFCQSVLPAELSQQESGVVVRFLAGVTGLEEGLVSFIVRKGAHFLEYLVLGISLFWTVRDLRMKHGRVLDGLAGRAVLVPWVVGVLYAVTDEVHQYFVPGRCCELRDVLIDACGVAAGVVIVWWRRRRQTE
jgi:VanZ family protein